MHECQPRERVTQTWTCLQGLTLSSFSHVIGLSFSKQAGVETSVISWWPLMIAPVSKGSRQRRPIHWTQDLTARIKVPLLKMPNKVFTDVSLTVIAFEVLRWKTDLNSRNAKRGPKWEWEKIINLSIFFASGPYSRPRVFKIIKATYLNKAQLVRSFLIHTCILYVKW